MSGYPLKTAYDATQKRKKYLEELALRARLDNENLQANKLYKRTGAISTPPDTRTTTEKLADLYRLRIDMRSKLGQLMSGDDAQKVVNGLDQGELVFLAGRIDKYITDLKPKYSMGMPYVAFNAYLKNAVNAYLSLGDVDLSTATLLQNMITPDDLDRVLNQVEQMTTSYEQRTFQGLSMMYKSLMNGIEQTTKLIDDGVIIDPRAIQDIQQVVQDAQQNVPTAQEIQKLQDDIQEYNTGVFNTEGERQDLLKTIRERLKIYEAVMGTLKNETEKIRDETRKITERPSGLAPSRVRPSAKIYKSVEGFTYTSPQSIPDNTSQNSLRKYIQATRNLADQNPQDKSEYMRLKFKITGSKDEILNKLREPEVDAFMERLWTDFEVAQQTNLPALSMTPASQLGIGSQLGSVKLKKATGPVIDPTLLGNLNQQQQSGSSGSTNLSGTSQPTGKSTGDVIEDEVKPYFLSNNLDYDAMLREAETNSSFMLIEDDIRNYANTYGLGGGILPSIVDWFNSMIQGGDDTFIEFLTNSQLKPSAQPQSRSGTPTTPPPNIPFDPKDNFADELLNKPNWNEVEQFGSGLNRTLASVNKTGKFGTQKTYYKYDANMKPDKNGDKLSINSLLQELNDAVKDEAKRGDRILVPIGFDLAIEWMIRCISDFDDGKPIPKFLPFYARRRTEILGSGLNSKKLKSKMKGGSVRIDINAGMKNDTNVPKYVPFGRYIINRSKLNDGVVMIKRPNGAFMGDLQSRRVSNNLRNVFEKVVGGNIPTYQDFAKLDEDEKQYLHYVSKKANLVDKLQVPTPNKDEEERMINRYEILRGQLVAGNDNKQMIAEFKKLLLDMSDRKLLPRRQVSDILIDIEKMYG
jgi:hypothetical protein